MAKSISSSTPNLPITWGGYESDTNLGWSDYTIPAKYAVGTVIVLTADGLADTTVSITNGINLVTGRNNLYLSGTGVAKVTLLKTS